MNNELLPCPFCGGEAELIRSSRGRDKAGVRCRNNDCGCGLWIAFSSKADAIEAWNTRAERTCHMERSFTEPSTLDHMQEYMCSECGEYAYDQTWSNDVQLNYCPNCGAKVVEK